MKLEIEHRLQAVSDLTQKLYMLRTYRLLGGVCLWYGENGRPWMRLLEACDIRQKVRPENSIVEEGELVSQNRPYFVVRTFR